MIRRSPWWSRIMGAAAVYGLCALVALPLWAMQRTLKAKAHNYRNAPIEIQRSKALLVETYTAPTQFATADSKARTTRVRYANRAGLAASVFILEGEITCRNISKQTVEVISLTIVPLDAFHQPVLTAAQMGGGRGQQIIAEFPRGRSKRIKWEQGAASSDVYEVAVIVTRVRFTNGEVWTAPAEELLDIF